MSHHRVRRCRRVPPEPLVGIPKHEKARAHDGSGGESRDGSVGCPSPMPPALLSHRLHSPAIAAPAPRVATIRGAREGGREPRNEVFERLATRSPPGPPLPPPPPPARGSCAARPAEASWRRRKSRAAPFPPPPPPLLQPLPSGRSWTRAAALVLRKALQSTQGMRKASRARRAC